jgi:membrane-associated protease RseP (regulator of RpoE activity)
MDLVVLTLGVLLTAAAVALYVKGVERHAGIFFVIRSGHGIRLMDRVARSRPRLWEFLADFSVLLSFGGIGAFYLSSNRETRPNLRLGVLAAGVVFSIAGIYLGRADMAFGLLALSIGSHFIMSKTDSRALETLLPTVMLTLACAAVFTSVIPLLFGVFGLPAVMVYVLLSHGLNILSAKTTMPGVSPMVPGSRDGNLGVTFPGYDLFIPWWYALISLFITLVAHEGAHGVLARAAGMKVKSTGILSVLSIPIGAFVEPDEEEMKTKTSVERMRVFTVGSFANMVIGVFAALALALSVHGFASVVQSDGMRVVGFMAGYPAEGVIPSGAVIYSVNGMPTTDMSSFRNVTATLKAGEEASVATSVGPFTMRLADAPEGGRGLLGVYILENLKVTGVAASFITVGMMTFVLELLGWIAFFNVNIALVNLLPVVPFDGGRMMNEVLSAMRLSPTGARRVAYASIAAMGVLLLANMLPLVKMLVGYVFRVL